MESVQDLELFESNNKNKSFKYKKEIKWFILSLIALVNGYATVLMYAQGEVAFALLTVVLTALAVYIFGSSKTYAQRYIYPGIAGMIIFIIFPLLYTVSLAFTNYSATNQLTLERTQSILEQRTFQAGKSYKFELYKAGGGYQIIIDDDGKLLSTGLIDFNNKSVKLKPVAEAFGNTKPIKNYNESHPVAIKLEAIVQAFGKKLPIKDIVKNRSQISSLILELPDGNEIRMSGLRKFAADYPLFTMQSDNVTLLNNQTDQLYKPNMDTGFYQPVDSKGEFVGEHISPGFVVDVGIDNFKRVIEDDGIKEPFVGIFIWTVVFAFLAVALTLIVGMVLACIVQWEPLKGSGLYRILLILPYAVPSFISILIFKGLFNQSFGEINMLLSSIFGIKPAWFSDPVLSRLMVVIVNTWLGFPYMMILCMGLLKSIPDDLYEASAIDGASPFQNFIKITVPLMIKPLTPLLIASFAFNFNNFVMIQLLTGGGPNMVNTSEPAGYTDLLVSYTYRIAFEGGGGQDFGLAGAIATIIFVMVAGMALLNLKFTKLSQD
ncbi:maltose ABC transporter permease MalF [Photobacterium kishitanii]|uniref:maltose ABC transporter permease MalF n=1 Tax=Photobacterium kishitanii TaxID=318456 RepID=UPI000D15BAEE|nr:maltose ABC transporter permease MalF [Photobacterium kishitanii]PSV18765.1 maltose ABC transporter permease MalF [Photobacterium kishitanii]